MRKLQMQQDNIEHGFEQLLEAMPNLCLHSGAAPSSPNDFGPTRQAITRALRRTKVLTGLVPEGNSLRAFKQGIQELARDLNIIHTESFKLEGKLDEARMANRLCLLHPGHIPYKACKVGDQKETPTKNSSTTAPTQEGPVSAMICNMPGPALQKSQRSLDSL